MQILSQPRPLPSPPIPTAQAHSVTAGTSACQRRNRIARSIFEQCMLGDCSSMLCCLVCESQWNAARLLPEALQTSRVLLVLCAVCWRETGATLSLAQLRFSQPEQMLLRMMEEHLYLLKYEMQAFCTQL